MKPGEATKSLYLRQFLAACVIYIFQHCLDLPCVKRGTHGQSDVANAAAKSHNDRRCLQLQLIVSHVFRVKGFGPWDAIAGIGLPLSPASKLKPHVPRPWSRGEHVCQSGLEFGVRSRATLLHVPGFMFPSSSSPDLSCFILQNAVRLTMPLCRCLSCPLFGFFGHAQPFVETSLSLPCLCLSLSLSSFVPVSFSGFYLALELGTRSCVMKQRAHAFSRPPLFST